MTIILAKQIIFINSWPVSFTASSNNAATYYIIIGYLLKGKEFYENIDAVII